MKKESKRTLTPKLRFPEFRGAGNWESNLISEVATISKGRGISKADVAGNGITPCIRYAELYTLYCEVINEVRSRTNISPRELVLSRAEDVILPASGETRADIATAACVMREGVALGGDLNILRSDLHGPFFSYLLNSPLRYKIAQVAQGDTVAHLYPSQISKISIAFPTPPEQQKIAECLGSLDELITAEGRKLAALRDHKRGLMQQLFPQPGQTQPRLRFPEFRDKGEWKNIPLGRLLSGSPDYGVNAAAVPFSENLPKYLRITDISDDGRYLPDKKVSVDLDATDGNYLNEGDIVLARTGASVGKSYRYRKEDGRLVFAGFLIRIKPDPRNLISTYLANFLTTEQFWKWVVVTSARSGQPGINSAEYSSLAIPLPPDLSEQQRIADCLSALDAMITAQAAKIDALKQHKRGLMQQLFPAPEEQ